MTAEPTSKHYAILDPDGSLVGLARHSGAPMETRPDAIELTEAQHQRWLGDMMAWRWDAAVGGLVAQPAPKPAAQSVPKSLVIERLVQAGALRAVRVGLRFGERDADLTDAELALRERFDAATTILADDEALRTVLRRAGVDPDVVLRLA